MNVDEKVKELITGGWLTQDQALLLKQAVYLLNREKEFNLSTQVVDYGFLVFTVAKVYEGFLKYYFYQMGFISKQQFYDQHLRIGKALNPDLPKAFRNNSWLYDDLVATIGDKLARRLWETWKKSRNRVFHYFPEETVFLDLIRAEVLIEEVVEAMRLAVRGQALGRGNK